MERPQSRIIDQQHVESEREVTGWEAEQLLRKYGFKGDEHVSSIPEPQQPSLTFEEMIRIEEEKKRADNLKRSGSGPITFRSEGGWESRTVYGEDEDTGFNFKIQISTDMKIPR
jgi:hypothetical protein